MPDLGLGVDLLLVGGTVSDVAPPAASDTYLRPGGTDQYLRPGGTDTYLRPV